MQCIAIVPFPRQLRGIWYLGQSVLVTAVQELDEIREVSGTVILTDDSEGVANDLRYRRSGFLKDPLIADSTQLKGTLPALLLAYGQHSYPREETILLARNPAFPFLGQGVIQAILYEVLHKGADSAGTTQSRKVVESEQTAGLITPKLHKTCVEACLAIRSPLLQTWNKTKGVYPLKKFTGCDIDQIQAIDVNQQAGKKLADAYDFV